MGLANSNSVMRLCILDGRLPPFPSSPDGGSGGGGGSPSPVPAGPSPSTPAAAPPSAPPVAPPAAPLSAPPAAPQSAPPSAPALLPAAPLSWACQEYLLPVSLRLDSVGDLSKAGSLCVPEGPATMLGLLPLYGDDCENVHSSIAVVNPVLTSVICFLWSSIALACRCTSNFVGTCFNESVIAAVVLVTSSTRFDNKDSPFCADWIEDLNASNCRALSDILLLRAPSSLRIPPNISEASCTIWLSCDWSTWIPEQSSWSIASWNLAIVPTPEISESTRICSV